MLPGLAAVSVTASLRPDAAALQEAAQIQQKRKGQIIIEYDRLSHLSSRCTSG